ncbi:MAG: cytochrome c [Bacteroidota bacterium]
MKILILLVGFMLFVSMQQNVPWTAPASADAVLNPLAGNAEAAKAGGMLFSKQCVICHGNKGVGDGVVGINLNPRPGNLLLPKAQKLTDGALFWKISNGKAPMPTFKAALSETQRWQLVDYVRELDKLYNKH